jgi:hypothetical protein
MERNPKNTIYFLLYAQANGIANKHEYSITNIYFEKAILFSANITKRADIIDTPIKDVIANNLFFLYMEIISIDWCKLV